jgi:hypothetical protein
VIRRMMAAAVLACTLAVSGCDGRRPPLTDFDQGFNAGITAVREARQKWGFLANAAGVVGAFGTEDRHKSASWNAGFRAGVKAELDR